MEEVKLKSCKNTQPSDTDLKAMVNNNWCFMETLLKEVKTKVSDLMNACMYLSYFYSINLLLITAWSCIVNYFITDKRGMD